MDKLWLAYKEKVEQLIEVVADNSPDQEEDLKTILEEVLVLSKLRIEMSKKRLDLLMDYPLTKLPIKRNESI